MCKGWLFEHSKPTLLYILVSQLGYSQPLLFFSKATLLYPWQQAHAKVGFYECPKPTLL
jgi:hypothetical protein